MNITTIILTNLKQEEFLIALNYHFQMITDKSIDIIINKMNLRKNRKNQAKKILNKYITKSQITFKNEKDQLILTNLLYNHLLIGGKDYKEYITNHLQERTEEIYNQSKSDEHYIKFCELSKIIFNVSTTVWDQLDT